MSGLSAVVASGRESEVRVVQYAYGSAYHVARTGYLLSFARMGGRYTRAFYERARYEGG
jgi:hypothetical protein